MLGALHKRLRTLRKAGRGAGWLLLLDLVTSERTPRDRVMRAAQARRIREAHVALRTLGSPDAMRRERAHRPRS